MKCPQCATEAPDSSRFCPSCGAALAAPTRAPAGSRPATANDVTAAWPAASANAGSAAATSAAATSTGAAVADDPFGITTAPLDGAGTRSGAADAMGGGGWDAVPAPAPEAPAPTVRRRPRDRPPMVALEDFGKAPPPPPRIPINRRNVAIGLVATLIVMVIVVVVFAQLNAAGSAIWGQTKFLDQRLNQ